MEKNKDFYKLIGKKYLKQKIFSLWKKINFNSLRKRLKVVEIITLNHEHEVTFSSGKEIITLNHEAFDRCSLFAEGAFDSS